MDEQINLKIVIENQIRALESIQSAGKVSEQCEIAKTIIDLTGFYIKTWGLSQL